MPAHQRIGPRRRRPRLGAAQAAATRASPTTSPRPSAIYFLEERYPKYGNIVPRDIATREIFQVCQKGLGVGGGNMVYLDLRDEVKKRGREAILDKLEGILEIYEKFVGTDPLDEPMKIFPAVHYTHGRPVGRLHQGRKDRRPEARRPGQHVDQHPRPVRHGRSSLRLPRRQPPRAPTRCSSCIFDGLFGGSCIKNYATDVAKVAAGRRAAGGVRRRRRAGDRQAELAAQEQRQREPVPALAGDGQVDDRQLHGRPPQRPAGEDARPLPGVEGALPAGAAFRHRHVDEPEPLLRPRHARHDPAGRGDPERALLRNESRGATTSRRSPTATTRTSSRRRSPPTTPRPTSAASATSRSTRAW